MCTYILWYQDFPISSFAISITFNFQNLQVLNNLERNTSPQSAIKCLTSFVQILKTFTLQDNKSTINIKTNFLQKLLQNKIIFSQWLRHFLIHFTCWLWTCEICHAYIQEMLAYRDCTKCIYIAIIVDYFNNIPIDAFALRTYHKHTLANGGCFSL